MNVAEFFFELDDPRRDASCYHVLSDIVMIVLCGYLADCEDFEEIHDYALDKHQLLKEFLELPFGIPSHDTLNRVFRLIDSDQLEATLLHWGKTIVGLLADKHLIVDGKQLRGTRSKGRKHASVQIVSLWAEGERVCLAQGQIADKTNEIKAIPAVLNPLDISGSVVSLDAIGCQTSLCEFIVADKKANYVIGLKANQGALYEQVVAHFERVGTTLSPYVSRDLGHDRAEKRVVSVSEDVQWLDAGAAFVGLQSVVMVQSSRWVDQQETFSKRFYISSLSGLDAAAMSRYIRRHWSIENELHWHLDVTFGEDSCRVRKDAAPRNLSTIRKVSLALLKRDPAKMSLARKRKKAARDDTYLKNLLSQLNS